MQRIFKGVGSWCLGAALLLAMPSQSVAHPHVWADISVKVLIDEQGRVEGLRQRWRLDPFYSLMLIEELKSAEGSAPLEARLDQLGVEINNNLTPQGYFTEIRHDGQAVEVGEASDYTTMTRNDRVEFLFHLPLTRPLALGDSPLRYQVYDPSYYIEMVHEINDDQTPRQDALIVEANNCTTRIIAADPDPEHVAQAARLDRTDAAPEGLGRFFTETGEIRCS